MVALLVDSPIWLLLGLVLFVWRYATRRRAIERLDEEALGQENEPDSSGELRQQN